MKYVAEFFMPSESAKEKFMRFVSIPKDKTKYWIWTGCANKQGYGYFGYKHQDKVRIRMAHRVSYGISNGNTPSDKYILHKCDNPRCVNPSHLWVGDQMDNVHDMIAKGRARFAKPGTANFNAKLSAKDIKYIRRVYALGKFTQAKLAEMFGVAQAHVSAICLKKSWATMP